MNREKDRISIWKRLIHFECEKHNYENKFVQSKEERTNKHRLQRNAVHTQPETQRNEKKAKPERRYVPITIIRRTPHRNDSLIKHELIPLHRKLMSTGNEVDRVVVREGFGDVRPEEEPGSAW